MNSQELKKEMNMSYETLTKYLQQKYGIPMKPYFRTPTCKSKSPISRTKEGLYCHHIQETELDNLSDTGKALSAPWQWQLPENLCYCNYLEHLLLHILINEKRCKFHECFVEDGIIHFMIPELNKIYKDKPVYTASNQLWRNFIIKEIENNYEEYCELIRFWLGKIEQYNFYWTYKQLINIII